MKFNSTLLYTWVERGTESKAFSPKTQHNIPGQGLTQTACSRVECTNHKANSLSTTCSCFLFLRKLKWPRVIICVCACVCVRGMAGMSGAGKNTNHGHCADTLPITLDTKVYKW